MSLHQHHPYIQYAPVMQHYVPPQSPAHPQVTQQQQQPPPQQTPTPVPPATTVAPNDTYTQQHANASPTQTQTQLQAQAQNQNQSTPLIAQGDWTKNLVHLAKTAELKKHALTLQLHTAHILSAHSQLEAKNKALQDVKEEKNRLESERSRLLNCLRQVNEDRDKTDLCEQTINKEISDLRAKIQAITDGEYAVAKREVDALRAELGQPPMPSLQQTLEEKNQAYLNERRLNGAPASTETSTPVLSGAKRTISEPAAAETPTKRPRGRPKGSKNKKNLTAVGGSTSAGAGGDAAGE
ncbi:uncharacterized protein FOMMEDRAFT_124435 [Fomitiporia mediterranea MF3/22]|uniref:uncharacterized protein n=1 Tax=Fomitiporia mediterranea (strain MF3/22) TaxID=694068 RepID=UPI0004407E99|nr:uncharacterized protein FOMMEDRAFT_124435 [Fomitiporia mediterranea MF3/22]EJD02160.1 hypothetical protein FOMMEDRAFT_124435 [Fomitiporia mediterranea MF3/22]